MKPGKDPPPYAWCLALTLLCTLFWAALDVFARVERLGLHAYSLALNLAIVVLTVGLASCLLAGALWMLERTLLGVPGLRPGTPTLMALYGLLAYVNVLYLRLLVCLKLGSELSRINWLFPLLFLVALPLYRWRFRSEVEWLRERGPSVAPRLLRAAAVVLLAAVLLVALAALNGARRRTGTATAEKPSILIVTCDAMRARSMSLYGYARDTTPNLRKLADTSYVFERFRSNYACTQYGMPALQGYCTTLGQDNSRFLASLRQAGYESTLISFSSISPRFRGGFSHVLLTQTQLSNPIAAGIRDAIDLDAASWLVSFLSEPSMFFNIASPHNPTLVDLGERLPPIDSMKLALDVLSASQGPSLVWVHLFQPHSPYDLSAQPYFGTSQRDRYDSAIHNVDAALGDTVAALRRMGLWDSILMVVSADHGESVGETQRGHEVFGHRADWINEWVAEVPLLIHKPGQTQGWRVATFAAQLDLAPTLLDLLKLPWKSPPGAVGESLVPYMESPDSLSPQVKVCLPDSHLMRQARAISTTENSLGWLSPNREDMIAYWDRYEVRWTQTYPITGEKVETVPDAVTYTAIYDVVADPGRQRNLYRPGHPQTERILAQVSANPLVKAAQTGSREARL